MQMRSEDNSADAACRLEKAKRNTQQVLAILVLGSSRSPCPVYGTQWKRNAEQKLLAMQAD